MPAEYVYQYTLDDTADVCFEVNDLDLNRDPDCPVEFPFDVLIIVNGNVYLKNWKIQLS